MELRFEIEAPLHGGIEEWCVNGEGGILCRLVTVENPTPDWQPRTWESVLAAAVTSGDPGLLNCVRRAFPHQLQQVEQALPFSQTAPAARWVDRRAEARKTQA